MKALKLEEDLEVSCAKAQESSKSCERKTRISFELHPFLMLEDLLDELDGCDNASFDGDYQLFEVDVEADC